MVGPVNSNSSQPGKKDRREAARELARIEREAEKRRQRRNRIFLQSGIGIGILAVIAIIAIFIVNGSAPKPAALGPKNMASDGVLISGPNLDVVTTPALKTSQKPVPTNTAAHSKPVNIVTYVDYQCPYCDQFETTNQDQISSWVKAGTATLEIHPISILDGSSLGTQYSSRAANAAACVANYDPNNYFAVNKALFANQPAEQTTGLTNAKILSVLKGAGSSSTAITSCVNRDKFSAWVTASTARVTGSTTLPNTQNGKFNGTPTVFVNGAQYSGSLTDPTAFATFVQQNAG
jgi:protein-disulfide isomerase